MNAVEILDIINSPSLSNESAYEWLYELIEAGYDVIYRQYQWILVDDCTYERAIW